MTMIRFAIGLAVACSLAGGAVAKTHTPSLRDRQQAACYDDAQRLCGEFVPDVGKVTACMKEKRAQVSPKCEAAYHLTR